MTPTQLQCCLQQQSTNSTLDPVRANLQHAFELVDSLINRDPGKLMAPVWPAAGMVNGPVQSCSRDGEWSHPTMQQGRRVHDLGGLSYPPVCQDGGDGELDVLQELQRVLCLEAALHHLLAPGSTIGLN